MRSLFLLFLLLVPGGSVLPALQKDQRAEIEKAERAALDKQLSLRKRSFFGISFSELDPDRAAALGIRAEGGVEVTRVLPDSAADKAGIRVHDILLKYNSEDIVSGAQLVRLVGETPAGRKVKIALWRDGAVHTVQAAPALVELNPMPYQVVERETETLSVVNVPAPALVWRNFSLGIDCESVESQLAAYFGVTRGLLVRFVQKGSIADRAGLHAGDVIVGFANQVIVTPQDLSYALENAMGNSVSVPVSVLRDRKNVHLKIAFHE
jgi:serine protease Do